MVSVGTGEGLLAIYQVETLLVVRYECTACFPSRETTRFSCANAALPRFAAPPSIRIARLGQVRVDSNTYQEFSQLFGDIYPSVYTVLSLNTFLVMSCFCLNFFCLDPLQGGKVV